MSHVLVLGANGMLGHTMVKCLQTEHDVTGLTSEDFNILHAPIDTLSQYINDDTLAVINCAGVVKPRINHYDVKDIFKINSWFPIQLGKFLSQWENWIEFVHISTDCVFTGNRGKYREDSIPDAQDLYGMSKAIGESCFPDGMVVRTSIIGDEIKNKYSLLEWAKSQAGKTISGWTDHIWSGVTTLELSEFVNDSICNGNVVHEIVHYASEPINKYDLLKLINEVYNLSLDIKKVDSGNACDRSLEVISDDYLAPELKLQLEKLKEFSTDE